IEELIRLVEDSDVAELTISGLFRSVRIVKEAPPAAAATVGAQAAQVTAQPAAPPVDSVEEAPDSEDRDSGLVPIASPMVGTFYSAPSPESPAYVRQGDRVSKGQVVCIVEAMKLLNEIESEVSGTVVRVAVENAQAVEFGQALFMVEPD
ncbi:MAG: acetyl-CoA carboxylase biotin carboxyl carrier protein, partial [Candidatus Eisenbacteria bacterium]|nr:acetyl-CoA carboxylase biotin carboxyl carrier protein [Candidatus Eisenbacteria bacterium]